VPLLGQGGRGASSGKIKVTFYPGGVAGDLKNTSTSSARIRLGQINVGRGDRQSGFGLIPTRIACSIAAHDTATTRAEVYIRNNITLSDEIRKNLRKRANIAWLGHVGPVHISRTSRISLRPNLKQTKRGRGVDAPAWSRSVPASFGVTTRAARPCPSGCPSLQGPSSSRLLKRVVRSSSLLLQWYNQGQACHDQVCTSSQVENRRPV